MVTTEEVIVTIGGDGDKDEDKKEDEPAAEPAPAVTVVVDEPAKSEPAEPEPAKPEVDKPEADAAPEPIKEAAAPVAKGINITCKT